MTDLHTRIVAAVQAKLELARAATPGPWDASPQSADGQNFVGAEANRDPSVNIEVQSHDGGWCIDLHRQDADAAFIAANDPATVIRMCERDLRVLERHEPKPSIDGRGPDPCAGSCVVWSPLAEEWLAADYPCVEVRDLATAYGLETAP